MEFIGPLLVFALIIGLVFLISNYLEKRKTEAVKAIAQQFDFVYRENPKSHLPEFIWQFDLFSKGRSRRLKNLIQRSSSDMTLSIGEYMYTTGSGKNSHTHRQTVVFIHSGKLETPRFSLYPENLFHKIGKAFGYQDINFDSHPCFSKRYLLRGSDEASIRDCFHDGVLEFFENQQQISVEAMGPLLMYYRGGRAYPPKQWPQQIDVAQSVYEQFVDSF